MSAAERPIDERREPLLGAQSFATPEGQADRPLDPDTGLPPEPEASGVDTDGPWAANPPPAGLDTQPPRARNRRGFSLLALGLVVGVLVLASLAVLFQSGEPQSEPAAPAGDPREATLSPTERLREELVGNIKSIQERLSQQQQERQAVTAEVDALRAQVGEIQQAPGSNAQIVERLATLESRLEALSDVELFVGMVGARLDELAARIRFLDDVLSQVRQHGSTQEQSAPPPPRVELPFHLAAIQAWDGRIFATLLHDGRQILVQPGDQCADWTVQSIDGARREVIFIKDGVRAVRRAPQ